MTDRELLELAAKAAEIEIWFDDYETPWVDGDKYIWNPLTDDGDALRLAVKLRFDISHNDIQDNTYYVMVHRKGCEMCYSPIQIFEEFEDESHRKYATRRAIVRAAANIGKEMT